MNPASPATLIALSKKQQYFPKYTALQKGAALIIQIKEYS